MTETDFTFVEGDLTDEIERQVILKKSTESFYLLQIFNGEVEIAPPNADYDLVFTQYTHVFHEPLTLIWSLECF